MKQDIQDPVWKITGDIETCRNFYSEKNDIPINEIVVIEHQVPKKSIEQITHNFILGIPVGVNVNRTELPACEETLITTRRMAEKFKPETEQKEEIIDLRKK